MRTKLKLPTSFKSYIFTLSKINTLNPYFFLENGVILQKISRTLKVPDIEY